MFSTKVQFKSRKGRLFMPLIHVKKNYQITIPHQLRSVLKIREGDLIEAEIEGGSIVLKPKSVMDSAETKRQAWIKNLIETGIKNPVRASEEEIEEIVEGCRKTRKEVYKELYGEEPK